MNRVKQLIKFLFSFFVFLVGLCGCTYNTVCSEEVYFSRAKSTPEIRAYYFSQLREKGVQVIQLGETLRIVLLSDYLFYPDSANIRRDYRKVLKTVVELINTYEMISIKVSGYTDNIGSIIKKQALTTRQAQVVARYLWALGVDARLTYARGYSLQNPVDWNGSFQGRHNNRRIEIYFRFYPKYISYA